MAKPVSRIRMSNYSKATSPVEQSFYAAFVAQLIALRKAQALTQEELDDRIGHASGLIAKYETFHRLPGAFSLMCWCNALGASLTATALSITEE